MKIHINTEQCSTYLLKQLAKRVYNEADREALMLLVKQREEPNESDDYDNFATTGTFTCTTGGGRRNIRGTKSMS